jgi:predicted CoA-substrate-specific enzyme activase
MADFTLGLDLGSRAVKAVLFDPAAGRIPALVVREGSPDKAADADFLLREIISGEVCVRTDIRCVVATGYGRGQAAFADERTTEISCHAAGVAALHPEVRMVIDIGGQDSKAIVLAEGGRVRDFAMNDRCAAGSGRFLEVVARILGTDVDGLSDLAGRASAESEVSSMCVVFAESEVIGMLARGFPREDIAAGILRSIARRVAGLAERIGVRPPVAFTGGVALNEAMAGALGRELREKLIIPPDPRITGALGAALLAARKLGLSDRLAEDESGLLKSAGKSRAAAETSAARGEAAISAAECGTSCRESGIPVSVESSPSHCASDDSPRSALLHRVPAVERFDRMFGNALEYAREAKRQGRKIVSIFCEFTPREVILAAGAVPVCACGGSHQTALAAERDLPAGLCPLIKSSYGFALEKASPLFELSDLIVAETTCDGKKKMFELLGELKPIHVLELPQKPDDEAGFRRWKSEIEDLRRRLEELTGTAATEDRLREAIRLMNRERRLRRAVARRAGKGLTGREVLEAKSLISGIPEDLEAYERIIAQAEAVPGDPPTRPRILMTGVPMPYGAEKVLEIIEAAGATVAAQENCTGLKPLTEDVSEEGDPLEAIARKYFHLPCSCMTPNSGRMSLIDEMIEEFRPDGIVDLIWQSCLTYDVESEVLKRHVGKKYGIPLMKIVTDYSPSDVQQLRLRVEAFLAMIATR